MRRFCGLFLLQCLLLLNYTVVGQVACGQSISERVGYLASDSLEGRKTGTPGCDRAAAYIRKGFKDAGLKFLKDSAFQYFQVTTDVKPGKNNSLSVNGTPYVFNKDFLPCSFSENTTLSAVTAFAGYGFDLNTDSTHWNDYQNLDVKGKWVMILRGNPEPDKENTAFKEFSNERSKVLTAKDKGAAGVLFVNGFSGDKNDELISLSYDKSISGSGIPVIQIRRDVADKILMPSGFTVQTLETEMIHNHAPKSFPLATKVAATSDLILTTARTQNVIGILPGNDPVLKNQVIIVGAHYDHLGFGGPGSGSRRPDTIAVHNGADDNASGTAVLIELARILHDLPQSLKRTVVFIAFSGEEMGLLGSSWYTAHPLYPLKNVDLMINFDMVGRMSVEKPAISIGGTGTFRNADSILNDLMAGRTFKATYSSEGYGPSDHASFYADSVPVLYINTGSHEDYHTPGDDAGKLNYDGIAGITDFACDLIKKIDADSMPLVYQEAGPREKTGRVMGMKVRLGIMPDFVNTDVKGVMVGAVSKNGPAEHAGILKGDVITAIDGKPVNNIYEYMDRMKAFSPGQTISVDIMRNNTLKVLLVQL